MAALAPRPAGAAWDPWRALRARPHVTFRLDPVAALLGGGLYARQGEQAAIVLDPALDRRARRVALAHELVHDEWGGGCDVPDLPDDLRPVVSRHEAAVDREVARRLVPHAALAAFLANRAELGDPPALWEVADEFDVDEPTAARALAGLAAPAHSHQAWRPGDATPLP